MSLLNQINSPLQLKELTLKQLPQLADEIRQEIIETVSETGGHLASSLGAVELVIALHYALDTPRDKIVWDVGHQAYAHKILTGRRTRMKTLRKWQGLSGFPNKDESIYDLFTVGHGSTSISTALGVSCGFDVEKTNQKKTRHPKVVAVIGDASLGGGMAFEALNHAGQVKNDLVVLLNDNKMAISKSVGALSHYLNRIVTTPIYNRIRRDIERLLQRVPRLGKRLFSATKRLEESLKSLLVPGILFEELGFRYFGPIDGHNIEEVTRTLKSVLYLNEPVLIHAITKKGKGYSDAEKVPEKFHGVSANHKNVAKAKNKSFTQCFSESLIHLAKQDKRIVAVTAAMPEGTGLDKFAESFPKRFYDVGMAEGHAVGFAAGLARVGLRPVTAIYSTFLQRGYDQIIHDVCLQNLPVIFCLDRAGIVGEDGPTHQGTFDIAYLRHIPNLTLLAPKDGDELSMMLDFALSRSSPVAIRYPKGEALISSQALLEKYYTPKIEYAKAELLRQGKQIAILALGSMVYPAIEAADLLKTQGIEATVVNMRFAKPLDEGLISDLCAQFEKLVTVEEGVRTGGFGSSILEFLEQQNITKTKVKVIALPSEFIPHAKRDFLLARYGLTADGIASVAIDELKYKKI